MRPVLAMTLVAALVGFATNAAAQMDSPPDGFTALFNGEDLAGWKGLVGNPETRAAMAPEELANAQADANAAIAEHWRVEEGVLINDGHGPHLCTEKQYGDFELLIDWKISPGADSGIYLRGAPQVQIWDPVNGIDQARVGSGGLYNNQNHPSRPLVVADNPAGEWNTFRIRMIGEIVRVELNDALVVDEVVMENYWDRSRPIYPREQIELQTHGGEIAFRNIFIREISVDEANEWLTARSGPPRDFKPLFNGRDLDGWTGSVDGYLVENGALICDPERGGTLLTEEEFGDFVLAFQFKLPPGGNNGLAVRAPLQGNPAYDGMELQILDNTSPKYAMLQPYQYHGSIYGVAAAHRGYLRPVGEWNFQEVTLDGSKVIVRLNGTTITEVDLDEIETPMDGNEHPGLERTSGHIGFMGHGDRVEFRDIRIRPLRGSRGAPDAGEDAKEPEPSIR
ncbi:MAG: DUF1080 domain-containing protein [Phycisphaerales bacterium]